MYIKLCVGKGSQRPSCFLSLSLLKSSSHSVAELDQDPILLGGPKGMPPRGYVLIFVFWALLTVITPTLISWSASAKPNLVAPGEQENDGIYRDGAAKEQYGKEENRSAGASSSTSSGDRKRDAQLTLTF
ncbi:hypothetical protein Cni_G11662 [Canna indica]|uniref:Uncharacterized protein n=1 Tax=Canna indica TaxID=4628 RepID=A0AAQ3K6G1_9LILI|nr:hypothetical protein Cni_G11662 [Canna indica]